MFTLDGVVALAAVVLVVAACGGSGSDVDKSHATWAYNVTCKQVAEHSGLTHEMAVSLAQSYPALVKGPLPAIDYMDTVLKLNCRGPHYSGYAPGNTAVSSFVRASAIVRSADAAFVTLTA